VHVPNQIARATLLRAATDLMPRVSFPAQSSALACAVSGGADSLALALLAVAGGVSIEIHHVDHGLRPESGVDAAFVGAFAQLLDLPFVEHRVCVALGPNVEARAREARFAVLPPVVATGHTADDVAETLLINLVRGSGLDGLAVLRNEGSRLHPIRRLRRSETRQLCADLGIEPFDDPMNDDASLQRVRMRTQVLPLLNDIAARDVVPLLVRLGDVASADVDVLESLAGSLDPRDAKALAAAEPQLARRALRQWLRDEGPGGGYVPTLAVVSRVYDVATGKISATEIGLGWSVTRKNQRLRVGPS
jgi:tRNA(Ile)-lysidine synthase